MNPRLAHKVILDCIFLKSVLNEIICKEIIKDDKKLNCAFFFQKFFKIKLSFFFKIDRMVKVVTVITNW